MPALAPATMVDHPRFKVDTEALLGGQHDSEHEQKTFFDTVQKVKQGLQTLQQLMRRSEMDKETVRRGNIAKMTLGDLYHQMKNNFDTDLGKAMEETVQDKITQITSIANQCKDDIKQLQADAKAVEEEKLLEERKSGQRYTGCEVRMMNNLHSTLAKRLHQEMGDFQQMQTERKDWCRNELKRQVKTCMGVRKEKMSKEAVEEEVEKLMASGQSAFAEMAGMDQASQTYSDVQDKHQAILRLEASIQELAELFQDMALLVSSQGEMLDRIERNVSSTVGYVRTGVQELEAANRYAKGNRKKMCCLMWILMVILVFVLGPILLTSFSG